jgi:hypothetical protein
MGGCGSGRHNGTRKRRVESCFGLDVRELRRKGALTPGTAGTLTSEHNGDIAVPISFWADQSAVTLCYHGQQAPESVEVEQRVALSSVPAAFGGSRTYFLCPGAECGQRVAKLYFYRGVFRCRRCHRLAYTSQCEDSRRRLRRRAEKLHARLGVSSRGPFRPATATRPKGMWSSTFDRLHRSAAAAEILASAAHVAYLWRLIRRIDRREMRSRNPPVSRP